MEYVANYFTITMFTTRNVVVVNTPTYILLAYCFHNSDFDEKDLEILAGSGDEGSEPSEEDGEEEEDDDDEEGEDINIDVEEDDVEGETDDEDEDDIVQDLTFSSDED